jgi:hypothetical protein
MVIHGPDPHNTRAMSREAAPIIETDRPCMSCGYNLRGLRLGIECPECGMPSKMPEGIDDPLSLMPKRVILAFTRGCWVASLCVGAMIAIVVANQFPDWPRIYSLAAMAGLSVAWVGAAAWLTPAFTIPQAVIRGFSRASRLRRAARYCQWGWVMSASAMFILALIKNPSSATEHLLWWPKWLGFAIGMTGIVLLAILLERLSEWARDGDAEKMFNWATWGLPIATPLLLADLDHPVARMFVLLMWLVLACTFPWGLISLSGAVTLSILHAKEHREREERRDERARRYYQHVAKTVDTMDAAREQSQGTGPPM